jgi:heterodisulfide reductase subunit D
VSAGLYWTEAGGDPAFAREVLAEADRLYSCIQCGSCTASCPTANRMTITPHRLSRLVRLGLRAEALGTQDFWLCTSCHACTTHCPRGIPLLDVMIGLKGCAIRSGLEVPEELGLLHRTVLTAHNISGDPNEERLAWSSNLPQSLGPIENQRGTDCLFYVGCVSSFYPRAHSIPQAFARTMRAAGISFTTLGGDEWCCGYPLFNAGLKDAMATLVEHNVRQVERLGVRTLVTACPSCYHAWKVIYPRFGALPADLSIVHASQYLAQLLDDGRLKPRPLPRVVTYHDPCDLGRKSGEYDAPRRVLESIPGVELREMANMREDALCCGGGGDVKIYSHDTTMEIAKRRIQQVLDVEADTVVSACQQCRRALAGAVQWARRPVKVLDLTEVVWESVGQEQP